MFKKSRAFPSSDKSFDYYVIDVRYIVNHISTAKFKMAQQPIFAIAKVCEIVVVANHCGKFL